MNFLRWGESAFFLAMLTQGVFGDIADANLAPLPSIAFVDSWVALVLAIVVFGEFGEFGEFGVPIAIPVVREARESGIGAGRCRLAQHRRFPLAPLCWRNPVRD